MTVVNFLVDFGDLRLLVPRSPHRLNRILLREHVVLVPLSLQIRDLVNELIRHRVVDILSDRLRLVQLTGIAE